MAPGDPGDFDAVGHSDYYGNEDSHLDASYEALSDYDTFGMNDSDVIFEDDDDRNMFGQSETERDYDDRDFRNTREDDEFFDYEPEPSGISDGYQIHRAFNGHTMRYRVKPNGDLSQHDAQCVNDCGACGDGESLPDW